MAKRGAKKDSESKKTEKTEGKKENIQRILVENFTSLQDVMTNLAGKFSNLSNQMSKLLELFEQSAKTFMEKDLKFAGTGSDRELISKLDRLIEQNKIIAQGITMLHEEHTSMPSANPEQEAPMPPMMMQAPPMPMNNPDNINRYQRSISSKQDAKIETRTSNTGQ